MPRRILIVDDEGAIRQVLRTTLGSLGFELVESARGEEAVSLVQNAQFDAVLLDINMPGIGGIGACRAIRKVCPKIAILMLTVRDAEDDKVEALEAGADDYVIKPFAIRELVARIKAVTRRAKQPEPELDQPITIGDIELQAERRMVFKCGQPVHLTPKEFDILHYLMRHPGRPVTHKRLLGSVWGAEYRDELEYLRTFMRQLRKKIEDDPSHPEYLLTDAYVGYRFREGNIARSAQAS
jgi:two-component system KDP operon response regulator KdpE